MGDLSTINFNNDEISTLVGLVQRSNVHTVSKNGNETSVLSSLSSGDETMMSEVCKVTSDMVISNLFARNKNPIRHYLEELSNSHIEKLEKKNVKMIDSRVYKIMEEEKQKEKKTQILDSGEFELVARLVGSECGGGDHNGLIYPNDCLTEMYGNTLWMQSDLMLSRVGGKFVCLTDQELEDDNTQFIIDWRVDRAKSLVGNELPTGVAFRMLLCSGEMAYVFVTLGTEVLSTRYQIWMFTVEPLADPDDNIGNTLKRAITNLFTEHLFMGKGEFDPYRINLLHSKKSFDIVDSLIGNGFVSITIQTQFREVAKMMMDAKKGKGKKDSKMHLKEIDLCFLKGCFMLMKAFDVDGEKVVYPPEETKVLCHSSSQMGELKKCLTFLLSRKAWFSEIELICKANRNSDIELSVDEAIEVACKAYVGEDRMKYAGKQKVLVFKFDVCFCF